MNDDDGFEVEELEEPPEQIAKTVKLLEFLGYTVGGGTYTIDDDEGYTGAQIVIECANEDLIKTCKSLFKDLQARGVNFREKWEEAEEGVPYVMALYSPEVDESRILLGNVEDRMLPATTTMQH